MKRILFVCLGNICRSPTAEGVVAARIVARSLGARVEVDSAGTSAYHAGERADGRMRTHAKRRGYELTSISRQALAEDFSRFDLIVAMDRANLADLERLGRSVDAAARRAELALFCAFVPGSADLDDVPDPYYGGDAGFERVLDLIEAGADPLLDHVLSGDGKVEAGA